jgi:hypothetical protein
MAKRKPTRTLAKPRTLGPAPDDHKDVYWAAAVIVIVAIVYALTMLLG